MVAVQIESLDVLRARYRAAVRETIAVEEVVQGLRPRPSTEPLHVFDTDTGLRLVISRDRLIDGRVGIHVSGSFSDPKKAAAVAAERCVNQRPLDAACELIVLTWRDIAQSEQHAELLGISDGHVPHFFIEDRH